MNKHQLAFLLQQLLITRDPRNDDAHGHAMYCLGFVHGKSWGCSEAEKAQQKRLSLLIENAKRYGQRKVPFPGPKHFAPF